SHSLTPLVAVGHARKAELMIRRGDVENGIESLSQSLERIHAVRYELITTEFDISLAQGLGTIGRLTEAVSVINETIQRVETNGDTAYMPELLRVKGCLLLAGQRPDPAEAEAIFKRSLSLSG